MSLSLPISLLLAGLSISQLALAAAPTGSLILCRLPYAAATIRIEHRVGSAQGALGEKHLAPSTLAQDPDHATNHYGWQHRWQEDLNADVNGTSNAYKVTVPTSLCHTEQVSVSLNVRDPAHSQVTIDEKSKECGGLLVLRWSKAIVKSSTFDAVCAIQPLGETESTPGDHK